MHLRLLLLVFLAVPVLTATVTTAAAATETSPGNSLDVRWGLGAAYGQQWYAGEGDTGTVRALQLTYRATITTPQDGPWLFELGLEHAESDDKPEVAAGEFQRMRATGLFYRISKFFGRRYYLGGRVGLARVRGTAEQDNLDLVLGIQGGVRLTSWLDAGLEYLSHAPSSSELPGKPGDVRGVITVSF